MRKEIYKVPIQTVKDASKTETIKKYLNSSPIFSKYPRHEVEFITFGVMANFKESEDIQAFYTSVLYNYDIGNLKVEIENNDYVLYQIRELE